MEQARKMEMGESNRASKKQNIKIPGNAFTLILPKVHPDLGPYVLLARCHAALYSTLKDHSTLQLQTRNKLTGQTCQLSLPADII